MAVLSLFSSLHGSLSPPHLRLLSFLFFLPLHSLAGHTAIEFLYPNFSTTYFDFVENSGVFLSSSAFSVAFQNPGGQDSRYYVVVLHARSSTTVWTANPAAPVPRSATLSLTASGLALSFPNGSPAWSTPRLSAAAAALQLLPSGELRLLDSANTSLWSSFDYPTDTLLPNQLLPVSSLLTSATYENDPAPGDYRLLVTSNDAVLQWAPTSQFYWSISSDARSLKDSNLQVAYLSVNATGIYLLAGDQKTAVFEMFLPPTASPSSNGFHMAKLDHTGRFRKMSFSPNESLSTSFFDTDLVAPSNNCDLPNICGSLGLCVPWANNSTCRCPDSFAASGNGCSPVNSSVLENSSSCTNDGDAGSPPSFMSLGSRIGYFGTKFSTPNNFRPNISTCQDLCSANCSCLGYFYRASSMSCYFLQHRIGSLFSVETVNSEATPIVYVKTFGRISPPSSPTRLVIVLLPATATTLLVISIAIFCFARWRRNKRRRRDETRTKSVSRGQKWPTLAELSDEEEEEKEEEIVIPGLPTRYTYAELEAATDNFQTVIGSGGFGCVYKGQLPDKSLVAVKRINAASTQQGRREFCTEIAVIGNIHHVNLVRLRGFCAESRKRLLVYDYMNRGSLDRALFVRSSSLVVLEWKQRVDVAVGAARGLAYLHAGCEHRIIHCDVKPENILLHDHNQVKIADFGLAKLMNPEQSGLFTTMRGTRGYLAPEWLTNAAISDKTDVYSFGMVLLEILRGRKNRADGSDSELTGSPSPYFPMLALEMHEQGRYEELADPRLEGNVNWAELERIVRVALCCLHEEPGSRPSMTAVVAMLEGTVPVGEPRPNSLKYLRLYGHWSRELDLRQGGSATSTTSGRSSATPPLLSYLSSQEVSGPR
ncbi:G-type lectin S-receptor-like serine/threonine-protein kinase At5g35370 [Zingiber officinale]|uniref:G-type lectin S-receptor-like serine/threonine-protein kinase At5g35370 n=1 Tax=Zingiber officinale TaxID=94328 RepID=UPI001C4C2ADC|nr:G-type lectin S-receptor-like serine/threonine-protein kinase At5g35370 [Zingiber officinale]